jgi:hypothetical protein
VSSENYQDSVKPDSEKTWEKALETLTAMSVNQRVGQHAVSPKTFISNLRLYANEMEKLLVPIKRKPLIDRKPRPIRRDPIPDCPRCGGQRELGAVRGTYDCYFCGLKGSPE